MLILLCSFSFSFSFSYPPVLLRSIHPSITQSIKELINQSTHQCQYRFADPCWGLGPHADLELNPNCVDVVQTRGSYFGLDSLCQGLGLHTALELNPDCADVVRWPWFANPHQGFGCHNPLQLNLNSTVGLNKVCMIHDPRSFPRLSWALLDRPLRIDMIQAQQRTGLILSPSGISGDLQKARRTIS